jgi:type II secretory pathway pseudopilin PulG
MTSPSPIRRSLPPEFAEPSSPQLAAKEARSEQPPANAPLRARKAIPASEQGYVMLIAIFFMALLVLSLAVAAPKIAKSIQRDRDLETWQRGMQYRHAIRLYYRKFNAYPPSIDALIETNDIRYLRKRYKDPITGQDDWKPILFGRNKTPTAMGFFGQLMAGPSATLAGIGPSGGSGLPGSPNSNGGFGSGLSGSSNDQTPAAGTSGSPDNSGGSSGTTSGTGNSGAAGAAGSSSSGTASTGISGDATSANLANQTFGGAGIIGFSPASPKQSILVYKKKNHYNEWEFTYDPISEMKGRSGSHMGISDQPAGSASTPEGTSSSGSSSPGSSNTTPASTPPETSAPQ